MQIPSFYNSSDLCILLTLLSADKYQVFLLRFGFSLFDLSWLVGSKVPAIAHEEFLNI